MKALILSLGLLIGVNNIFSQNIVDINSILINGKIPINTSKKTLETYFGINYKKEKYQPECGYFDQEEFYNVKFFYYKKRGLEFIVYKSIAEFKEIDLTKNDSNFVQIGKFKINYKTSLVDLKKQFPKSYRENIEKDKNGKEIKQPFFRLDFDKETVDKLIIELNEKNKVIRFSYFCPC